MKVLKQMTAVLLSICFVVTTLSLPKAVYADNTPVRETTVDTPADGNILVKIRGDFSCMTINDALDRLNEIRLEACKEGVMNPATGKKLTMSDYQPLTWDSNLEWIAQTRAAEAALKISHSRPLDVTNNPSTTFSVTHNGKQSWAENLAWNYSGMEQGIEQWYEEKEDYTAKTGGVTGHYESIISTNYKSVALGAFHYTGGKYPYAISQEFGFDDGNGEKLNVSGNYDQMIEIPISTIKENGLSLTAKDTMLDSDSGKITLSANFTLNWGSGSKDYIAEVAKGVVWSSSDSNVLTVDSEGNFAAKKAGKVTITATVGERSVSKTITVTCSEHKWDDGKVTKEPTCEEKGSKIYTCTKCGTTKNEEIPALGHDYGESLVAQKASFGQKGIIEQKCVRGDDSKKTTIPAIAEPILAEKQYTYNGNIQKPDVSIRDENDKELPSSDYEVTYDGNCKEVGTYKVTITLKGDHYEGTKELSYEIVPKSIEEANIIEISNQIFSGIEIEPTIIVQDGDAVLKEGTDYSVNYSNNMNSGQATVTITGKGNYIGTKTETFQIEPKDITKLTVQDITDQTYTGSAITPKVEVKDGKRLLEEKKDYEITYQNNVNVGTATVTVNGVGNYKGNIRKSFTIEPRNMTDITIYDIANQGFTGEKITPNLILKYNGNTLKSGTDYDVDYKDNIEVGTATVTVTGKSNYTGSKKITFKIVSEMLQENMIMVNGQYQYTGNEIKPSITVKSNDTTLEQGKDYKVDYKDNIEVGTATVIVTGIGNYAGEIQKSFKIQPISLDENHVRITGLEDKVYTGEAFAQKVRVFYDDEELVEGTDYEISYRDYTNAGTAKVIVTGKGHYGDRVSVTFDIKPKTVNNITISDITDQIYKGTAITPKVEVKDGSQLLEKDKDYTISYQNNVNVGTATVVLTGINNYTGTKTVSFQIVAGTASDNSGNENTQNGNTTVNKTVKVQKVAIAGISKKIAVGKKITLKATVSPSNATNKKVTWKSSNTKVATVNSKGVVTIKKKTGGKTVTITATAGDGSGKKATYKINVMKGVVKKVTISGNKPVKAGKTLKLKAKVTASKGANKTLQWTSGNTKYAKVSSSGKVTALKTGKGKKVKITAMATDGSNKKKSVTVKIK